MIKRLALIGVLIVNLLAVSAVISPALVDAAGSGWFSKSQSTGSGTYVVGPSGPPAGVGSFNFTTGPGLGGPPLDFGLGGKAWLGTQQFDGTLLKDISALSYSTYVAARTPGTIVAPALQLQVDVDDDGDRDTTLVFEPYYSTIANGGTQPDVVLNTWQTWDARAGKWWFSNSAVPGYHFFSDIINAFPNARIVTWFPLVDGYGTQLFAGQESVGLPWENFDGNVDNFSITTGAGTTTVDFEPATHLVFATQPGNGHPGQPLSAQPVVHAVDGNGVLSVDFNGTVTLALGANPGGATLGGTTSVAIVNGVATFTDLSVSAPGTGYTLTASAPGLTGATSGAFDVTALPSHTLTLTIDGTGSGSVGRNPAGTPTGATTFQYGVGATVTLTANQTSGDYFFGWRVDGTAAGQVNPLVITMDRDHTIVATFSDTPPPTFSDVPPGHPAAAAISQLVQQGVILGYEDGTFGPDNSTLRGEMAAMIARTMGWDAEDHGNPFSDQCVPPGSPNCVDSNIWRNVGTVAFYDVAQGYDSNACAQRNTPAPCFGPLDEVSYAQTISFITRAMVTKGYWVPQPDNSAIYPNVPPSSGHRADIATYVFYAGALPGTASITEELPNWAQPSPRSWFALALTQAINSYFAP